jgi:hypothetical protein
LKIADTQHFNNDLLFLIKMLQERNIMHPIFFTQGYVYVWAEIVKVEQYKFMAALGAFEFAGQTHALNEKDYREVTAGVAGF